KPFHHGIPHAEIGAERAYEQNRRTALVSVFLPMDFQSVGDGVRHVMSSHFGFGGEAGCGGTCRPTFTSANGLTGLFRCANRFSRCGFIESSAEGSSRFSQIAHSPRIRRKDRECRVTLPSACISAVAGSSGATKT